MIRVKNSSSVADNNVNELINSSNLDEDLMCEMNEKEEQEMLDEDFNLPDTYEELLKYAEGKSVLNNQTEREGIVVRTQNKEKSFKVISNKFLLKNGE